MFKKQDKNYVSELDNFLIAFDAEHPEQSASQQQEIAKHAAIAKRRDTPQTTEESSEIWADF